MKISLKTFPLLLLLTLCACSNTNKNLFWIGSEDDFIFMAESTNVLPIKADSLVYYLTAAEIFSAEKLTFKNFGTIHSTKNVKVLVLLKEASDIGRNYTFIIRTFDPEFKLIDSYELASWIDTEERYCLGSISDKLTITRTCENGEVKGIRQIMADGRIVLE